MPRRSPMDPLEGPKLALAGRVVTMDERRTVLQQGTVWIDKGRIAAVRPSAAGPPEGFEGVEVVASGGTILPGLIELHNHLAYNALRLWDVPQRFHQGGAVALPGPARDTGRAMSQEPVEAGTPRGLVTARIEPVNPHT